MSPNGTFCSTRMSSVEARTAQTISPFFITHLLVNAKLWENFGIVEKRREGNEHI